MAKVIPNRVFEDYDPPSDLVTEEGCDTLLIYLPGFKKEQLKVQLTISRMLKISGERPLGDNKYRRFQKEFRLPSNCDTKDISAKFEGGILYVRQPKITTPAAPPPPQQAPAVQPPKTPRPQQPPPPPAVQPSKTPRPQQPPPPQPPAVQTPKTPRPQPPPAVQPPKSLRPQQPPRQPPQVSPPPPPPPPQAQPPPPQLRSHQQAPPSPPQQPPQLNQGFSEEHREEEQRAEEKRKEEMRRKEEESSGESGVVQGPKQEVVGSGLFRELKKPDNVKRLGVSVLLVLLIAFYISYMFKSLMEYDQEIMSEYQEL